MIKLFFRWLVRVLYGFHAYNEGVLKTPGPVLLIPNHTSWLDWLFVGLCLDRDWKFVVSSTSAETSWLHRKIMINRRTFPIDTTSPTTANVYSCTVDETGKLAISPADRVVAMGLAIARKGGWT